MTYAVRVSSVAADQIAAYQAYIAEKSGFQEIADRWAELVYDAIGKLHYMPGRFALAEEDRGRDYDIHRQIIGSYLALYTIDEDNMVVKVIGFRHGSRLPRPEELSEEE